MIVGASLVWVMSTSEQVNKIEIEIYNDLVEYSISRNYIYVDVCIFICMYMHTLMTTFVRVLSLKV